MLLLALLCVPFSSNVIGADIAITLNDQPNQHTRSASPSNSLSQLAVGDTLDITLTNTQVVSLSVRKISDVKGVTQLQASSSNNEFLLINFDRHGVYGSLSGNNLRYNIHSNQSGEGTPNLTFVNQNHANFPEIDLSSDALVPPTMVATKPIMEQLSNDQQAIINDRFASGAMQARSTIRLLILYSPEFANGFNSPSARINQLISFTNTSFTRSNIPIDLVLAAAIQVNFNNNLNTGDTLDLVTNAQGAFSNVEQLRDTHAADMVAVLSFSPGFSANGIAWVNGSNPNFAFSSTRLSPGCCDSVFAHEIGHNLGSGHERNSVNPSNSACNFNFTGYSCGHGNRNNAQGSWGTVMSRLNSTVVNHVFSNPNLTCLGEPCGISQGQTNSADNFASFNMSRLLVANFRPDPPTVNPPPRPRPPLSSASVTPVITLLLDEDE